MRHLVKPVVVLAVVATACTAAPAGAVHESHHGPFVGRTSQGERIVMRVTSHTRIGIRFVLSSYCGGAVVVDVAAAAGPFSTALKTNLKVPCV